MSNNEVKVRLILKTRVGDLFAQSRGKMDMWAERIRTARKHWSKFFTLVSN